MGDPEGKEEKHDPLGRPWPALGTPTVVVRL